MRAPRSMFLPLAAWDQPVARGRCKFLSLSKAESFGPYGPNSHRFRPSRRPQIPGKFLAPGCHSFEVTAPIEVPGTGTAVQEWPGERGKLDILNNANGR